MNALEFFLCVIVLCCAVLFGWAIAHSTVAAECEKLGGFYVGKQVYECQRKSVATIAPQ